MKINIAQASYTSSPDAPIKINIEGQINNQPLSVGLSEDGFFAQQYRKPMTLVATLKLADTELKTRLGMQIEQLDYGVLARRVQADSDLKGKFNLNLKLYSEADTPIGIKENLNGSLQFGVVPEQYKAGVIDLWAVNILTAALPVLMKGSDSEVNCLAGEFTLVDGMITPEVFILDTSRIHVEGLGTVNLKTDTIDFHLKPTPKSAHFFSAATPVSISGNLFDPDIGVSAGNVIATAFRMVTGIVTPPPEEDIHA